MDLPSIIIYFAILVATLVIVGDIVVYSIIGLRNIYEYINKHKMKNEQKGWPVFTDDFSTIERLVKQGQLATLDYTFSWKHLRWGYVATMKTPIV